jgi:tetratricopeptide (TPR) repeat protein
MPYFENLRKLTSEYVGLYYILGELYFEMGNTEKAFNCVEEGISLAEEYHYSKIAKELQELLRKFNQ